MFARLLRRLYLLQVLTGSLLGVFVAAQRAQGSVMAWVLALAVLLPILIHSVVIGASMVMSRPPQASLLWWRAFGGELLASLQIYGFQLPWCFHPPQVLLADTIPGQTPVLLVHGYISNHRMWDKMIRALHHAGHSVHAVDLEPIFTSIDDYAAHIEQAVILLQNQTGASKVALVGHSMGGLAIRAWMRTYGHSRIRQVITLGTPHQGTPSARLTPTANAKQMTWHSDWLQALQASETHVTWGLMQIALSQHDNVVYPQREQVAGDASVTEFQGIGHIELSVNNTVIAWVLKQLQTP
jgi:triacylglycerol esterase/lipase EstA (alpha/beta hydrolase family)